MATESSEKYILYYFAGRGLAESIRIMLALCGLEWEERYIRTREDFLLIRDDKKLLAYGCLPLLICPADPITGERLHLVQSQAILRYLANKYDRYGSTPEEKYNIDSAYDSARDVLSKLIGAFFAPSRETYRETTILPLVAKSLPYIERQLARQAALSPFFASSKATFADAALFEVVDYLREFAVPLEAYPHLVAHFEHMKTLLVAFLQSPHRHPCPTPVYVAEVRASLQF